MARGDDLSVREAAELLDVSEETVRRLFDRGVLKGHRTTPLVGNRRIYRASAEEYKAEHYGEAGQADPSTT